MFLDYDLKTELVDHLSNGVGNLWLFEGVINSYGSFLGFSLLLPQFLNFAIGGDNRFGMVLETNIGLSVCAIFLILAYVLVWVIPAKAKYYIVRAHPEYNLV